MSQLKMTVEIKNKLSGYRFDGESLESADNCLRRASGIAGFLVYAASLGDTNEMMMNDLEQTISVLQLEIDDAIGILNDYSEQQRKLSD